MIVFDLETTGLPKAEGSDLDLQPRIIEFGAIRFTDGNFEEYDRLEFMCNPGHDLDPKISKITGIKDEDLKEKKPFIYHYKDLCKFFLGETSMAAHNLPFDRS
jgi:DNA polymerase III epsilon subunit-like protein